MGKARGAHVLYFLKPAGKAKTDEVLKVGAGSMGDTGRNRSKSLAEADTKGGRALADGPTEESWEMQTYFDYDEQEFYEELDNNYDAGDIMHAWRVIVKNTADGPEIVKANYGRGYIDDLSEGESSADMIEVDISLQIEGASVRGDLTADDLPEGALEVIQYGFAKPDEVGQDTP